MAWKQTTEDPDRYINTDQANWIAVVQNGAVWDITVNSTGGQFVIGSYASKALAETALATLVLTF